MSETGRMSRLTEVERRLDEIETEMYANKSIVGELKELLSCIRAACTVAERIDSTFLGIYSTELELPTVGSSEKLHKLLHLISDIVLSNHTYTRLTEAIETCDDLEDQIETEMEMCKLIMQYDKSNLTE